MLPADSADAPAAVVAAQPDGAAGPDLSRGLDSPRLHLLARAGEILTGSLDYETTLGHVAQLLVPALADWCVIDLLDEGGNLQRVATFHPDPGKRQVARDLDRRYPPRPDAPAGPARVARTGQAEWEPDIPDAVLRAGARDAEHYGLLKTLGLRSYICVPMAARGRTLGVLTLVHAESGRSYGPDDLALAGDLARRAALAVDNARLYREARQEIAERDRARQLLDTQRSILAGIATGTPLPEVLASIVGMVEELDRDLMGSVLLLDESGERLRGGAAPHLPPEYSRAIEGLRIGPAVGSCGTAAFRKAPVLVDDIASDPLWADFRDLALGHGLRACWSSPALSQDGAVLGTVAIYSREPRRPDAFQRELLETATYLAGIAIAREQAQGELERGHRWFSMTLRGIGDAVIAADARGCVTFLNPAAEQLTGWTEEEARGRACREVFRIVDARTRQEAESPVDRVLREDGVVGLANHTLLIARDGAERPIDDSGAPIRDVDGSLLGIVLVFRDITERARADRALRESEERYRNIVETASEGVWMVDRQYRTTFANQRMADLLGYTVEEMRGRPVLDFMDAETAALTAEKMARRRQGMREQYDARYRRKDGSDLWVLINTTPLLDGEGRFAGALAMMTDITTRVETERALRASEERYRTMVETANEGVWLLDAGARTLYVNARMASILGYAPEEMRGCALTAFCAPGDAPAAEAHLRANLDGRPEEYDFRFLHRDGHPVPVLACTSAVCDADGKVIGALGLYSDISDRVRADAARARAQEEAETRARQQRALADLGVRALTDTPLEAWMQEVAETVARILDVDFCKVLELLPSGDVLLKAGIGWREGLVGHAVVPTGLDSQAGYTLLSQGPVIVEDLSTDTRFRGPALLVEHGVVSGISVIVYQAGDRPWGVMGAHTRHRRRFTPDDVAFFQSVANLMALVLERHQHNQEIADLNRRLQRAIAETHHRVKNNLQVISALIDMQAGRDQDAVPLSEIRRLGQHVRGLAAIHDLLTREARRTGQVEYLSARDALEKLMPSLQAMSAGRPICCQVEDVMLPIRQGTSLAVLVNELVSNATKHGAGQIDIRLTTDGPEARLLVSDNGPGFPPGFDAAAAAHTGLDLVESVGRWDLQGRIAYENRPGGGGRVTVAFPLSRPPGENDPGRRPAR